MTRFMPCRMGPENERIMRESRQGFFDPAGRRNMNDVCQRTTFRELRKKRCEASERFGTQSTEHINPIVNNSRLKSKALLSPVTNSGLNIRACLRQPLGYQQISQTLQIPASIEVAVRNVTTVFACKSVLVPCSNGIATRTGL